MCQKDSNKRTLPVLTTHAQVLRQPSQVEETGKVAKNLVCSTWEVEKPKYYFVCILSQGLLALLSTYVHPVSKNNAIALTKGSALLHVDVDFNEIWNKFYPHHYTYVTLVSCVQKLNFG